MCKHRALAGRLAPLVEPSLPGAIARATVRHTWASYSQSMDEVILSAHAHDSLLTATTPVHLIVALDDPVPDVPLLSRLREGNDLVSLEIWARGGHHLPLTQPAKCVAAIAVAVGDAGGPPHSRSELASPRAALCEVPTSARRDGPGAHAGGTRR
jgi:pimeloyl-ACP methyl ester carboxylesterase